MKQEFLQYLCCPKCKSDLINGNRLLICQNCGEKYEIVDDNIIKIVPDLTPDLELSIKKWDKFYQKQLIDNSYLKEREDYLENFFRDEFRQMEEYKRIDKDLVYLEIGCGPMIFGQEIADKCKLVIGVDFCPSALKIAKRLLEKKGFKNYLLIQGDILNMPLKSKVVDLLYGGGVIEHFKDTQTCVDELYRVLKPGGISFNTVPCLNIGSLTYRQIWGNIPNVSILKQLAEFVHMKLLRAKHMRFGYEMSFLGTTLKRIHKKAGFRTVVVDKFEVSLVFKSVPKLLRPLFIRLANLNRLFWPMVKVIAKK